MVFPKNICIVLLILIQSVIISYASIPGIPHLDYEVDVSANEIEQGVRHAIQALAYSIPTLRDPNGKVMKIQRIDLHRLAIGMTNKSFKCTCILSPNSSSISMDQPLDAGVANATQHSHNGHESKLHLMVRTYGTGSDVFTNRDHELAMMNTFSEYNIGAKLYSTFTNGYIAEFLFGRILEPQELSDPKFYSMIASQVARVHLIKMSTSSPSDDIHTPAFDIHEIGVWNMLERWVEVGRDFHGKQELFISPTLEEIRNEIDFVKSVIKSSAHPEVPSLAHNDINHGNIIYNPDKNTLTFVDFEASHYGDRHFDLGNHFCEWSGLDLDWSRYPTRDQQLDFLRHYLAAYHSIGLDEVDDSELQTLLVRSNQYSMVSHLLWHVWAVIQSRISDMSHDYLGYARKRMEEHNRRKNEFLFNQ